MSAVSRSRMSRAGASKVRLRRSPSSPRRSTRSRAGSRTRWPRRPRKRERPEGSPSGGLDGGGDVVVEALGAAQGAADALDLELAGGELAGGLPELVGAVEAFWWLV